MISLVIIALAFAWLAYETDWMRVRLQVGISKPKRNPWLDKAIICRQCRDSCSYQAKEHSWLCYKIPARTMKLFGSTLNFIEGCNYHRAQMLKDIIRAQKSKAKPQYPKCHGFGFKYDLGDINLYVDGKQVASINGGFKSGMIKQALKPYTTKARVGKQTVTFDFGEADRLVKV